MNFGLTRSQLQNEGDEFPGKSNNPRLSPQFETNEQQGTM